MASCNCAKRIHYRNNRLETTGTVLGYEVEERYTSETPPRFVRKYYPQIKYYVEGIEYVSVAKNIRKSEIKSYAHGDRVNIYCNRKFPEYFFITGNQKSVLYEAMPFAFGCIYLFLMNFILEKISAANLVECIPNYSIAILIVIIFQTIRLSVHTIKTNIYHKKNWIYSLQGVFAYWLICISWSFVCFWI